MTNSCLIPVFLLVYLLASLRRQRERRRNIQNDLTQKARDGRKNALMSLHRRNHAFNSKHSLPILDSEEVNALFDTLQLRLVSRPLPKNLRSKR